MLVSRTVAEYHDNLASVILSAPDRFYDVTCMAPVANQPQALRLAFDRLRSDFRLVRSRLKDDHMARVCEELIVMALEAYEVGDTKTGAHTLGEFRGMVWPSWSVRPKYAVEAERRAFGTNSVFADVVVSPFPYEGTSADLGADQAVLLSLAQEWCRAFQRDNRDFKYLSWVVTTDGNVRRISVEPKEDESPTLLPIQRSSGLKRLKELAGTGEIRACVLTSILAPQGTGIVTYDLEQRGRPRVSARQTFERKHGTIDYAAMRFHLEDPDIFPESPADVESAALPVSDKVLVSDSAR